MRHANRTQRIDSTPRERKWPVYTKPCTKAKQRTQERRQARKVKRWPEPAE